MKTFKEFLQEAKKLKAGHVRLVNKVKAEKSDFGGYRLEGMSHREFIETKYITIERGFIVGADPRLAKNFNWETVGEIQPKSPEQIKKEKEIEANKMQRDAENKAAAKIAVFQLFLPNRLEKISPKFKEEVTKELNKIFNSNISDLQKIEKAEAYLNSFQ